MTTEVTPLPYQTREEYLKQEGFDHMKFGDESIYIFFKDFKKEISLLGRTPNDRIKNWDKNKQNIWNAIEHKSDTVKTALVTIIHRKLTLDNIEEQRSPTRRPPPKETRIESFRSNDGSCFVVASKESAPFGKKVIVTMNRILDWNRESAFDHKNYYMFLLDIVEGFEKSTTIWNTVKASLEGWDTPDRPGTYHSVEFGEISYKKLIQILINIFGAKKYGYHGKARKLVFDLDKLNRVRSDLSHQTLFRYRTHRTHSANPSLRREHEQPMPVLPCYSIVPVSMLPMSIALHSASNTSSNTYNNLHFPFFIGTLHDGSYASCQSGALISDIDERYRTHQDASCKVDIKKETLIGGIEEIACSQPSETALLKHPLSDTGQKSASSDLFLEVYDRLESDARLVGESDLFNALVETGKFGREEAFQKIFEMMDTGYILWLEEQSCFIRINRQSSFEIEVGIDTNSETIFMGVD